jgi:nitroimidazol reductase NimA-like FMN-containing flavoprotein (pyridoxamine 5'-phosphate oxidase superfamily)
MTPERLADPSIQGYLATRDVVVLAAAGLDGGPWATPMWFLHSPDALFMISVDDLPKVKSLRRDPRVAVAAETTTPEGAIRGVVVKGRAEFLPDSDERRRLVERFLEKYHPRLERLWRSRVMPGNRVMFRIAPERVRSWGLA